MDHRGTAVGRVLAVCALSASGFMGCGGGSAASRPGVGTHTAGDPDGGTPVGTTSTSIWTNLPQVEIALIGGSASSAGGTAQSGGSVHLMSAGGIKLDQSISQPQVPTVPSAPAGATSLRASSLGADFTASGAITIEGTVQSGGTDPVRKITASGDVVVSGTLQGAELGASRQGFDIEAPGHTIYVAGTIDVSGGASGGKAGGSLTLVADQVVVAGSLLTAGAGGTSPGVAGAVTIQTTSGTWLAGTMDASGGDGSGASAVNGARGGDITIASGGDLLVGGTVRNRGGAAVASGNSATGGDAGKITVDCPGMLTWPAALDGRGGLASAQSGGGTVAGGAAATLTIGQHTPPKAIGMLVPVSVAGGVGDAVGGGGGMVEMDAPGGDLLIAATSGVDASGGDSAGKPGDAGTILLLPASANMGANLDVSGKVTANGGSGSKGSAGAVNGGAGGMIKAIQQSLTGNATTESTAVVQANGGNALGGGTAGGGGSIYIFTSGGNGTVHGQVQARGGGASDPGGTGGGGGLVYVFTGNGHNFMSGVLLIASDGVIDASGGTGTIGGSARNNGMGGVNSFPSNQSDEYDVEEIAVLINSDGVHGSDRGYIDNQGKVIAQGGKSNGSGGDVVYHGKQQDGNETPLPGNVASLGDGTGMPGDFAGE